MEKNDLIKFLKESLRVELDFDERWVPGVSDVNSLKATIYIDGDVITKDELFIKNGKRYPTGEGGEPWSPSYG